MELKILYNIFFLNGHFVNGVKNFTIGFWGFILIRDDDRMDS